MNYDSLLTSAYYQSSLKSSRKDCVSTLRIVHIQNQAVMKLAVSTYSKRIFLTSDKIG